MSFHRDVVYWVRSDEDPTVLLAIDVRVGAYGLEWFDTVRERVIEAVPVPSAGEEILCVGPRATYRFTPLTLAIYDAHVQDNLVGRRRLSCDEELHAYFRSLPR